MFMKESNSMMNGVNIKMKSVILEMLSRNIVFIVGIVVGQQADIIRR